MHFSILSISMMLLAYLFGSLCSAIIICKAFGLTDPRSQGSNNPGATNVLRLHGKKFAAMVLLGDMLKGTLPVVIGRLFHLEIFDLGCIALFCVLVICIRSFFILKVEKAWPPH